MPLRRKLLLSMVTPALLLLVVGVAGVASLDHLRQVAGRILSDNYQTIQQARRLERSLSQLEALEAAAVPAAEARTRREVLAEAFEDALRGSEGNVTEPGEAQLLASIREQWTTLRQPLPRAGAAAALHGSIAELVGLNERAMFSYERETGRVGRLMIAAVAVSALAATLALGLFALASAGRISRPVREVADRLHRALNPGHAAAASPPGGDDEIERLRLELDDLLGRLARYEDEQHRHFDDARRRFISMLSHQLKTPMTSLSLSVNLLREKLRDASPQQRELLDIATEDCASLSRLVSELIEAAREAAPDLAMKPRRRDLAALLRSALRPLVPQAEERGVDLALPPEGRSVHALVDPVKFPWVVANIAGNALRYTGAGGRIAVTVSRTARGIEIAVADTGCGIAAADLESIFEPYYTVDDDRAPGTHGLGLAIAREIVAAHGGTLDAESEPGRGTVFRIRLPAQEEPA